MNVWFAANIPIGSSGGVARSARGFAEGLRLLGHRTLVVFNDSHTKKSYALFILKLAARLLLNRKNPPDWIIARSTDGVGCALLIKAFALKTKLAIHNHGWEEHAFEIERRLSSRLVHPQTTWKARLVRFPLLRMCLILCASCLSGTISEIRWLKRRYPRHHQKMRYIPNGVQISPHTGFWTDQTDIPLNILAIGGATWKKNLEHTVAVFKEVVRHLPASRLFLIGAGLQKKDMPFQLSPEITVVAEERSDAMAHWYATCPYFISSSRYEGGHSFAILEALSFGCIVFSSEIPSSKEIIKDKHNGLLITGIDVHHDAAAVVAVLKGKELFLAMRRHAFYTAQRNRWDRQVKRLEHVLCVNR